jgi:hypothetical protein
MPRGVVQLLTESLPLVILDFEQLIERVNGALRYIR